MILEQLQPLAVSIDNLMTDPRNARKHNERNLVAIKRSLEVFGQRKPIVVNAETGYIEAGNGMYQAAKELGWTEIAVVYVKDDHAVATAYGLMDNKSAELAEWDLPVLKDLLQDLDDGETDIELTGFDAAEIEDLMNQVHPGGKDGLTDDDAVPEDVETICKPGDLWQLGNHRLLCGDATKKDDVERLMGVVAPLLCVTDPPYGVDYDPNWRSIEAEKGHLSYAATRVTRVLNDDRIDWTPAWQLTPCDVLYCWHAGRHASNVQSSLELAGYEIRCQVIWAKSNFPISRGHYHWRHEPCWYAVRKGRTAHWIGDRKQTTLWEINLDKNVEGGHSTQKPVECMLRPIRNHEGDVYDPFGGSGTTLIACEKLDRKCYMMEIDPHYCDVILKRWSDFTGKSPMLLDK